MIVLVHAYRYRVSDPAPGRRKSDGTEKASKKREREREKKVRENSSSGTQSRRGPPKTNGAGFQPKAVFRSHEIHCSAG